MPVTFRSSRQLIFVAAVAVSVAACASSGSSAGASGPRSSPSVITSDEIAKTSVQNAFDAVQKLRPSMLRQRQVATANAQSSGELVVYVDNSRFGNADALRQIAANQVASLRYYTASEAQLKWGSGHPGGAIEVTTKR